MCGSMPSQCRINVMSTCRDGIKFPDMVHALKPNPKNHIQEGWRIMDFFSHVPESMNMVCVSVQEFPLLCVMAVTQHIQARMTLADAAAKQATRTD